MREQEELPDGGRPDTERGGARKEGRREVRRADHSPILENVRPGW